MAIAQVSYLEPGLPLDIDPNGLWPSGCGSDALVDPKHSMTVKDTWLMAMAKQVRSPPNA